MLMFVYVRIMRVRACRLSIWSKTSPEREEQDEMHCHSEQPADETCEAVEPIPRGPIPGLERDVVAVVVMHVFELHTADAADAHQQSAEERDDEDADEVSPAV